MKASTSVPAWLIAAALCVPILGLTSPLLEVDDARYAQVPAEMAASGDWVLPTLDGTAYVEKPPLWYWTAASSYKLFGTSEGAARAMMLLFALLGAAGAWWLGSWLYEPGIGLAAAAATASASLWLFLTHNMTLDMPLSVCLLWTTALALRAMARPEDARWAAPAAWLAAALAFLSKGLISVLLPGLWVCGLAVLFPKLRRGARALISPLGIALAAAVAAPWFFAMQKRRPDFFHVFFVEQHFQRFLTQKYNRDAPRWFYLAVLPSGLLPWTVPFLTGLARAVRRPFGPDFRGPALAAWTLGVAAFFSTSHSKLATYVLPVFPHACLLAVAALDEGVPERAWRGQRALGILLAAAAALAAVAWATGLLTLIKSWPPRGLPAASIAPLGVLTLLLVASLAAALIVSASSRRPAAVLTAGGALAGVFLFLGLRLAAPLVSARDVGAAVRAEARDGDAVWTYGTYLHGLPFYARRPVDKLVLFTGEFHYAKRDPAFATRFGDDADVKKSLPRMDGKTFVVMRTGERPHFAETVGGGFAAVESWREFGPWSLAVIRPRAAATRRP